jgi:hypothetical protein
MFSLRAGHRMWDLCIANAGKCQRRQIERQLFHYALAAGHPARQRAHIPAGEAKPAPATSVGLRPSGKQTTSTLREGGMGGLRVRAVNGGRIWSDEP